VKRALVFLLALGCDDPLAEAQRIESTRVIGARVESAGDAARAWPEPGEVATVSWLVADPRPAPPIGWAFSVCAAAPSTRGVPECESPPFAELASSGLSAAAPSFDFTTPVAVPSGRVLVRGAVCADAEPVLAEPIERSSCNGDLALALLEIELAGDGPPNRNPSIGDEPVTLDGVPWAIPSAAELALAECSPADGGPAMPVIPADGRDHELAVELSTDDREPLERVSGPDLEDLFVSHFSSAGRFEWPISVIDPSGELSVRVPFRAPESVSGSGEAARVWLVVRDLRGGADWTLRTVCFVP
jgi:hypothetical protein